MQIYRDLLIALASGCDRVSAQNILRVLGVALLVGLTSCAESRSAGDGQPPPSSAAQSSPETAAERLTPTASSATDTPLPSNTPLQATATALPTAPPTSAPTATVAETPIAETATTTDPSSEEAAAGDEELVRQLVWDFGQQLHFVSLTAPPEVLAPTMQKHYGAFVSDELHERWMQEPLQAPGRLTSSPWPERIDLWEVQRIDDAKYLVKGAIIEVVGPDKARTEIVNTIPVELTVERGQDGWRITDYSSQASGSGGVGAAS